MSGATEFHFLSTSQFNLNKAVWDTIREGMVCGPPTSFGDIKTEIEQLCSATSCTYEQIAQILDRASSRMEEALK